MSLGCFSQLMCSLFYFHVVMVAVGGELSGSNVYKMKIQHKDFHQCRFQPCVEHRLLVGSEKPARVPDLKSNRSVNEVTECGRGKEAELQDKQKILGLAV